MAQPEQQAREEIDRLMTSAGWLAVDLAEQHRIVAEVDRLLSIAREAEAEVEANLKRAQELRQAILSKMFQPNEGSQ